MKLRLDYDEMRPWQHEKSCEESGFQVFFVKDFAHDLLLYMIEREHKAGRNVFTCLIPANNYDAIYCAQKLGFRMEKAYARMFYLLENA